MLFFISNAIETQLLSTGAFEISLNGKFDIDTLKRYRTYNDYNEFFTIHILICQPDVLCHCPKMTKAPSHIPIEAP